MHENHCSCFITSVAQINNEKICSAITAITYTYGTIVNLRYRNISSPCIIRVTALWLRRINKNPILCRKDTSKRHLSSYSLSTEQDETKGKVFIRPNRYASFS